MARFCGRFDSREEHRFRARWASAFSNRGRNGSTEALWLRHGKAHTYGPHIILIRIFDIAIKFDVVQRNKSLSLPSAFSATAYTIACREHRSETTSPTANQRLVLGHASVIALAQHPSI
jgi:hypothetical protein